MPLFEETPMYITLLSEGIGIADLSLLQKQLFMNYPTLEQAIEMRKESR